MSNIEVKNNKRVRSSLRGFLTRTENYISGKTNIENEEISIRLTTLQENLNKFYVIQEKIELHTDEEQLEEEIRYRYEFEELFTMLKLKLLNLQKENNRSLPECSFVSANATPSSSVCNENIPKMTFQPLEGKESFSNFTRRLEVYFLLNKITDPKTKVYVLLSAISPDLHEKIYDLCSPEDPLCKNFEELTKLLDDYMDPKPSIWALQHKFITRTQQDDESITMYASELKKLSTNCEFKCKHCNKETLESFLSLQFIRGLKDSEIRTKILQERESPSFSRLIQIATAIEMGKVENLTFLNNIHTNIDPINRISNFGNRSKENERHDVRFPKRLVTISDLRGKCYRCGKEDHKANECGAKKSICLKCHKEGHLARVCLQRNTDINQVDDIISNRSHDSIAEINLIKSEMTDRYVITINIENKDVKMEFDTGATLSSMSLTQFRNLNIDKKIFKTDMKLRTYTGEIIKPTGVVYVKCMYKKQRFFGKLYIINQKVDAIFGRSWIKELDISLADIKTVHTSDKYATLDETLKEFSTSVFRSDLGKIPNFKAHLHLKENTQPIFIKPRRIPYALKTKVDEEIERLCAQGVLTRVDHSEWGTPVVPIVKPNGSIRLCADYKITLNKVISDEKYPIPIIEDIFSEMNGGILFCTLDISQAYLNMEMDEESALLQALSTHKGTYKVNRLMFGVKVAPSLWQKFMDNLLVGLEGVKCFFDDIIIQGSSERELMIRLQKVLHKLKDSNLRVNKEKCHFFKRSIDYLGHTIDKDGLHKNIEKIKSISNAERPKNVNELRTFLGMANYYNKFIPNLASITNPLNELLKKNMNFNWTSTCETAFNKIKEEIISERVLIHFDPLKPLILATDASPTGLGAVLSHKLPDGSERPIAFASRCLTTSEKKYSQIDKEATAIYWGLKKFFHYCYGRKFTLITDHKPLTSIFHPHQTLPALSTMRLFHYAHFLSGFDYDIEYRTSSKNSNADYLSRFPVDKINENTIDQHCSFQIQHIHRLDISPEIIAKETELDPELKMLIEALKTGRTVQQYGYKDNELTLQDNCILKGTRVMIPHNLRPKVLNELHVGHIGILKMKLLARSFVYWKNIDKDIENKVKSCRPCRLQQNEPSKTPIHHWEDPSGPWQRIHIDFAGPISGHQLLIVVDAYSKWTEIIPTKITTSTWCIRNLKEIFCSFGIPNVLVSDNGRQFTSQEFKGFLSDYCISHRTTAPYHPSTNGQAERFVQTIKKALQSMAGESGSLYDKLLTTKIRLRRTPNINGFTPYELMFNREIRTYLHAIFKKTVPLPKLNNSTPLRKQFGQGDRVQVRSYAIPKVKWEFGVVTRRLGRLHYEIRTDDGKVLRRHIDQMLPAPLVE